jgi:hypothetical protein
MRNSELNIPERASNTDMIVVDEDQHFDDNIGQPSGDTGLPSRDGVPAKQTYAAAGAATLALFGGIAGVLVGWLIGAAPRSIPGQGTLAGADIVATTLVAGLFGVGMGALVGALWGSNIPRESTQASPLEVANEDPHSERVVPLDYIGVPFEASNSGLPEAGPELYPQSSLQGGQEVPAVISTADDLIMPAAHIADLQADVSPDGDTQDGLLGDKVTIEDRTSDRHNEEDTMNDRTDDQVQDSLDGGQDPNNVTGTRGAIDPETGAYGTAGTPVTTGYGVSGSTIGTGSEQVRDEHEAGDFVGSTPDSASYEMGGRGSDDTPTASYRDDSSDTPVTEKYRGSMADEAPAQSDPSTEDVYEAGPAYGPEVGQGKGIEVNAQSSRDSDTALDSPPSSRQINSGEIDASAGTNIAGTSDPRGLGDNTDET